jgi:hypothetical protein
MFSPVTKKPPNNKQTTTKQTSDKTAKIKSPDSGG